ncbi:MAG: peptidylprolyl isomerase [Dehalococcoidales bacterium]
MAKKTNLEKAPREMTHRQLSRHRKAERRQRFIFFGGIGIIVAVVLIILGGWFAGEYMPMHRTLIQVYDTKFDALFVIDTFALYGQAQGADSLTQMSSSIIQQIIQDELLKQAAAKIGITVSDADAKGYLDSVGIAVNDATLALSRGYLLQDKVKNTHFGSLAPTSDNQTWVKAMMVESLTVANLVREKIVNGENFSQLADLYATDTASQQVHGDYGWHPLSLLKNKFYSTFPFDYISRADAKAGDISLPISDNVAYKKLGYWLIRVNSKTEEGTANVSAVLLSSEEQALAIRARLLAGDDLAPIAGNLSQFSTSKQKLGEMGIVDSSENITDAFNRYVFDIATELGAWSQPVKETEQYTQSGYWVVQIAGQEQNKPLTSTDRDEITSNLYSDWLNNVSTEATPYVIQTIDEAILQWVIDKATLKITTG